MSRGFTLLEVLVALAIFAIMSLITYRGVNMVIDTRTAVVNETVIQVGCDLQRAVVQVRTGITLRHVRLLKNRFDRFL